MVKKLDVPFYKSRGFECGQTCVAMMIKYYKPNFEPDYNEFNSLIRHINGKYTFPPQLSILLDNYGVKSKVFSSDTISKFSEDINQFKRWYGSDLDNQMKFIDKNSFDYMVETMRSKNLFIQKNTKFDEILSYFDKGYLVGMPIDWNTLSKKESTSYAGHFVIISGFDNVRGRIFVHDPDIGPYQEYSLDTFKKSWDHPAIADDFIVSFGLK